MLPAVLSSLPVAASAATDCRFQIAERIFLASYSSDPNVFVWDNRDRLVAYAASGGYAAINDVVRHSLLVKPGTQAIVAMCRANVVRRRYVTDPSDAVGIKITVGPLRNHWGWVSSEDVHELRKRATSLR
jgi:hypothetical protein